MFFYVHPRAPSPLSLSSSSTTPSDASFLSDNFYIPSARARPVQTVLRELTVRDLDDVSSIGFCPQYPIRREPFRIPRPVITLPRPIIHVPSNNSLWPPNVRPTRIERNSRSPSPALISHQTERPVYQNLLLSPSISTFSSPPPAPSFPLVPSRPIHITCTNEPPLSPPPPPPPPPPAIPIFQQFVPIPVNQSIKTKEIIRDMPPGLFTTLCSGGLNTLAAFVYLLILLALPITKLVLGIVYFKQCPIDRNIPIYVIVSGACGLASVIFLFLSSASSYCRARSAKNKSTHSFFLCITALSRGMRGALGIFLFVWFFCGCYWIFNARYRLRADTTNYCHPTLFSFAYYVLIFTFIYAGMTGCIKCCVNFFCCGMCDIWFKAFS